jgi:hypothetical protein
MDSFVAKPLQASALFEALCALAEPHDQDPARQSATA